MRKALLLLLLCCLLPVLAFPLFPLWKVRNISVNEGLSQNTVYCVHQDLQGFIWLGTGDGLNLLKGSEIVSYRHQPANPASLPHNVVRGILGDGAGNLYIGTEKGLSVRKPGQAFYNPRVLLGEAVIPLRFTPRGLLLWLQCKGLYWYHPGNESLLRADEEFNDYCRVHCLGLTWAKHVANGKEIMLSTSMGFFTFKLAGEEKVKAQPVMNHIEDCNICVTASGESFLIGNQGAFRGLPDGKWQWIAAVPPALKNDMLKGLIEIDPDHLLLGTYGKGLWLFNRHHKRFTRVVREGVNFSNRPSELITTLFQEQNGNLWIGTDGNGIELYRPEENLFLHVHSIPWTGYDLGSDFSKSFVFLNDSLLLFSCFNTPLQVYDTRNFQFVPLFLKTTTTFCGDVVHAMARRGKTLLLATAEGLWQASFTVGRSVRIRDFRCLDKHESKSLTALPDGEYACNAKGSLLRIQYIGGSFTETGRVNAWEPALVAARPGSSEVYLSRNKQVMRAGWPLRRNVQGKTVLDLPQGVGKVFFMKTIGTRLLLIGTNNGLFIYQDDSVLFRHYHTGNGLPNNYIYAAIPDRQGMIWCSSNGGISCINLNNNKIRNFGIRHGVQSNEFNSNSYITGPGGAILFGGIRGFNLFYPEKVLASKPGTALKITSLTVNDLPQEVDDLLALKEKRFAHHQNNWWFRVAALDLPMPDARRYAFFLQGYDDDWIFTGSHNAIRYLQLPPGSYRLFARISAPGNDYSNSLELFSFSIRRPFYRTWWFVSLSALLFIALVYSISRVYLRAKFLVRIHVLEKEKAVQEERLRISKDMHDDIGTGISQIAIMSEIVKQTVSQPEKFTPMLEKISRVAGELIDNISNMIWITKPEYDNLESLVYYMREYAGSLFDNTGIDLRFDLQDSIPPSPLGNQLRKNIFLIYKELLNNILKHAAATAVRVTINYGEGVFRLEVRDDGKGFDPAGIGLFSEGLNNMKKRAGDCRGDIRFNSRPGEGTLVVFSCSAL